VHNGHQMMGRVTGTGCTATVMIGAFLAVDPDSVEAATTGLAYSDWRRNRLRGVRKVLEPIRSAFWDALLRLKRRIGTGCEDRGATG